MTTMAPARFSELASRSVLDAHFGKEVSVRDRFCQPKGSRVSWVSADARRRDPRVLFAGRLDFGPGDRWGGKPDRAREATALMNLVALRALPTDKWVRRLMEE